MSRRDRVPVQPDTQVLPDIGVVDVRTEVYAVIDDALARFQGRAFVSGAEVVDVLLDLRGTVEIASRIALAPATTAG